MLLYHLEKYRYKDHWPPEGTLYADGRWNTAGQWIIYTSPTIALAKLEILANESNLPIRRVCMEIEVPEEAGVYTQHLNSLPKNWMQKPYPVILAQFTVGFLASGDLLMQVPSAQSTREFNYLINVRHPLFHANVHLVDVFDEPLILV